MKSVIRLVSRHASRSLRASVNLLFLPTLLGAEPSAQLIAPESTPWTGQRTPFFIELRAEGSFSGSASFDIPQIPRTVVIKLGNPVISSESTDRGEIFVQRHEFALFSQASGTLTIPPITARFSHRKGYSGPSFDVELKTKATSLNQRRPEGSGEIGFLITTGNLKVTESWDPSPGPADAGAIFKRTITQRAEEMTGMAFAPASLETPDGVRIYPPKSNVTDTTDRGTLIGERQETLTYLFEKPGIQTLPEIRYTWWNPETESFGTTTLPARVFEITAAPQAAASRNEQVPVYGWFLLVIAIGCIWQRRRLVACFSALWTILYPLELRAYRSLLAACRKNDPHAANLAWLSWRNFTPSIPPDLQKSSLDLQRHLFGASPSSPWDGSALVMDLRKNRQTRREPNKTSYKQDLPPLNP